MDIKAFFSNIIENIKALFTNLKEKFNSSRLGEWVSENKKIALIVSSLILVMIICVILLIVVETNKGVYRKDLTPADEPKASFKLQEGENVLNVYAFCNLHGLWKASL